MKRLFLLISLTVTPALLLGVSDLSRASAPLAVQDGEGYFWTPPAPRENCVTAAQQAETTR